MSGNKRFQDFAETSGRYYAEKLKAFGTTPKGVDWNSPESQALRFEQLLKAVEVSRFFSINDYGCGYGAIVSYMLGLGYDFRYSGFDISSRMIEAARGLYGDRRFCTFTDKESRLRVSDYTVASGIFNVRLGARNSDWQNYILHTLERLNGLSAKGFSFNVLTKYSDREYMKSYLYYADLCFLFDYCKRNFSRNVALLHDYGLYEFTMIVRKKPL